MVEMAYLENMFCLSMEEAGAILDRFIAMDPTRIYKDKPPYFYQENWKENYFIMVMGQSHKTLCQCSHFTRPHIVHLTVGPPALQGTSILDSLFKVVMGQPRKTLAIKIHLLGHTLSISQLAHKHYKSLSSDLRVSWLWVIQKPLVMIQPCKTIVFNNTWSSTTHL